MELQALAGAVLTATDISDQVSSYCGLTSGVSSCTIGTAYDYGGYVVPAGQTLRVDYTCLCGAGNAPPVDPVSGACTPCTAGAPRR